MLHNQGVLDVRPHLGKKWSQVKKILIESCHEATKNQYFISTYQVCPFQPYLNKDNVLIEDISLNALLSYFRLLTLLLALPTSRSSYQYAPPVSL